jgi:hypothetical protein
MAQWQGFIHGSRGPATRLGTKKSGLEAFVGSWQGRVVVSGYTNPDGVDMVIVRLGQHSNGAGTYPSVILYDGPIAGIPNIEPAE